MSLVQQELIACKCQNCDGTGIEKEKKCPKCDGIGSSGVLPIYEIVKFDKLDIEDEILDLKSLLKKGKMRYLSKHTVVQKFYNDGLVHQEDYERIINTKAIGD